jgi:hypothetical protein
MGILCDVPPVPLNSSRTGENCEECARLRRIHSAAHKLFLKIASERQAPSSRLNPEASRKLDELYQKVGEERRMARRAIEAHRATHFTARGRAKPEGGDKA